MSNTTRRYFGTDGIRGAANKFPLDAETALKIGRAAAIYFAGQGAKSVAIGKDTRASGYMLESALAAGALSMGINAIKLGVVPTPAVSMLTQSLRAGFGIMISASHNPYSDNGIKFFNARGQKLSDEDEAAIEALIDSPVDTSAPRGVGKASKQKDASGRYIEFVKKLLPAGMALDGIKIALDAANGAAFRIAPAALRELGADVVDMATAPNGSNINEKCGSTHPEGLAEKTRACGAAIGVALDGDADRIIVCDEGGNIYSGDHILAVLAVYMQKKNMLPGNALAVTRMSNLGMEEYLRERGISLVRTDVGDRFVAAAMRERGLLLGGEQSGHIILGDSGEGGDGLAAAIRLLAIMRETNAPASKILGCFTPYPQIIHNVRFADGKRPDADKLQRLEDKANADLNGQGRIILRRSGTEPLVRIMIEGKNDNDNTALAKKLAESVSAL